MSFCPQCGRVYSWQREELNGPYCECSTSISTTHTTASETIKTMTEKQRAMSTTQTLAHRIALAVAHYADSQVPESKTGTFAELAQAPNPMPEQALAELEKVIEPLLEDKLVGNINAGYFCVKCQIQRPCDWYVYEINIDGKFIKPCCGVCAREKGVNSRGPFPPLVFHP